MQIRRTFLLASLSLAALPLAPAGAVTPSAATSFMDGTAKRLVAVVNSSGGQEAKRVQLSQIVDSSVAVDEVGRFCLGRFWRVATPAQRQEYLRLFHGVLVNSLIGHLGDYKGVTYSLGRPVAGEGGIEVPSTLDRPGQPSVNLTWVIDDVNGRPKIIDLLAEGTSLRITQRSDYSSFLDRHNGSVAELLAALRRQVSSQTG